MEYSSAKKARLPGISFDFGDGSDSDDDSWEDCHHDDDDDHPHGAADPSSSSAAVNVAKVAPTRSSSDEATQRRPSGGRGGGGGRGGRGGKSGANAAAQKMISPTTLRLHRTADELVELAEDSTLERVEDTMANVVSSVKGLFWGGSGTGGTKSNGPGRKNDDDGRGEGNDGASRRRPAGAASERASEGANSRKNDDGDDEGSRSVDTVGWRRPSKGAAGVKINGTHCDGGGRADDDGDVEGRSHPADATAAAAKFVKLSRGNHSSGDREREGGEEVEQTAVLDAAAAYLARMEGNHYCYDDDGDDCASGDNSECLRRSETSDNASEEEGIACRGENRGVVSALSRKSSSTGLNVTWEASPPTRTRAPALEALRGAAVASSDIALDDDDDGDSSEDSEDFVPDSLKNIFSQQESELTEMLSSIDALTSTPARIARNCEEEILEEVDDDVDFGSAARARAAAKARAKDDGDASGVGEGGDGGDAHDLSPVKKRLMMDGEGEAASPAIRNSAKRRQGGEEEEEARREPGGSSLEPGRLPQSPGSNGAIDLSFREFAALPPSPRPRPSPRRYEKERKTASSPSQPRKLLTTAASTSFKDAPESQSPSRSSAFLAKESELIVDGPPEEEAVGDESPPDLADARQARGREEIEAKDQAEDDEYVPDSIQQLFRDADSILQDVLADPVIGSSEMVKPSCDTFCEDYIKPPSSSPFSSSLKMGGSSNPAAEAKRRAEEERLTAEREQAERRRRAEEERIAEEEARRAEEEQRKAERERAERRRRAEEERIAEEEARRAEEEQRKAERERAEQRWRAEEERIAEKEARRAEKGRLAAKRGAEEEERLAGERRRARRRAEREERAAAAKRKRKEMKAQAQRAEGERMAAEAAERARLERRKEEDAWLREEAKVEAERAEKERLAIKTAKQAELEKLERERIAVAQRQKKEEARLSKEAEAKQAENERLAGEAAKQAELEKLERERIERERAVAARGQKEEEARLLKQAKAEAERAEKERLAVEKAKQVELKRLESERIEQERAIKEKARLLNEAKAEKERAEKERLATERAERAELKRIERRRATQRDSAAAAQRLEEEEARLLNEAEAEPVEKGRLAIDATTKQADFERQRGERKRAVAAQCRNKEEAGLSNKAKAKAERVERFKKERLANKASQQAELEDLERQHMGRGRKVAVQFHKEEEASLSKKAAADAERVEKEILANEVARQSELDRLAGSMNHVDKEILANEVARQSELDRLAGSMNHVEKEILANEVARQSELDRLAGSMNHLSLADYPTASAVEDDVDILEKADNYMNGIGGIVATNLEGTGPPALKMPLETRAVDNDVVASSPSTSNEKQGLGVGDSRPSTGSNDSGVSDESAMDESMFMPNMSIDVSDSPKAKQVSPPTEDPLPPTTENESDSEGDCEEAFFPNRDLTIKSRRSLASKQKKSTLEKDHKTRASLGHAPSRARSSSMREKEHKSRASLGHVPSRVRNSSIGASKPTLNSASARDERKPKAVTSAQSTPVSLRPAASKARNPVGRSMSGGSSSSQRLSRHRRAVTTLSSPAPKTATSKPKSRQRLPSSSCPPGEVKPRKVSAATLRRRNRLSTASSIIPRQASRKATPLWSPPSGMKPAKKRSKSSSDSKKSLVDMPLNTTTEKNAIVESRRNRAVQNNKATKPSLRNTNTARSSTRHKMRSESGKSAVIAIRGKENKEVGAITKLKSKAETASSQSMKQSLVSMTRSRLRSQSKKVDMARLERLARPRPQSMARPRDLGPVKTAKKKGTSAPVPKPPSLLSRTAPARAAKSTAEMEAEEMENIKPFRARRIQGSSAEVKSRFKTPISQRLTQVASPTAAAESNPKPPCAKPPPAKPPTARLPPAKPPSFPPRESGSGLYKPTPPRKKVHTLGESVQHYLNHCLRDPPPTTPKMNSTPKPPSFLSRQSPSHSCTARSSEDIDLDECKKQFQARPIAYAGFGSTHCIATPSNCDTAGLRAPSVPSSEEMELEECRKQFRARPLPSPRAPEEAQRRKPQITLTTPSPFKLHTNMRAELARPAPLSSDELELARPFRALPMPHASPRVADDANSTPYHVRAQIEYEKARERKGRLIEEEMSGYDFTFKAKPLPKTTYVARPIERTVQSPALTRPKSPRFSLIGRIEERKLFDQHAEGLRSADSEAKQRRERQLKEMEEEEIRRQRSSFAEEGGYCFKAKDIGITYK